MSDTLIYTVLVISTIGIISALILYYVSQKFKVFEDPRIDIVEAILPGANCGGCGLAGCRAFAEACVNANDLKNLFCTVGGNESMDSVATSLGLTAIFKAPRTAVVRCNGTCAHRPKTSQFDGASTCAIEFSLYSGESDCSFGCLGLGDCVPVCNFDAIHLNSVTGLPEITDEKCTACGACVEACPKMIIELRKQMPKFRKIYVACMNKEKGGIAKKACEVACIGCGKCEKICEFDAIQITNNLAFIDSEKCKLCRKCVSVCPTNSILETNFPPQKIKPEAATEKYNPIEA